MAQAASQTLPLRRDQRALALGLGTWQTAGWLPLLALLAGLVCLIYLIATSSVLSVGYDIQRLERERDDWRARNEQLQLELAKGRSLAWIQAQATTRLEMVKPETLTYVRVEPTAALANDVARTGPGVVARPAVPDAQQPAAWQQLTGRLVALLPGQP